MIKITSSLILSVVGLGLLSTPVLADSPFRPKQSSFGSPPTTPTVTPPAVQQVSSVTAIKEPVKEAAKPVPLTEKMPTVIEQQHLVEVKPEKKAIVDLSFKAASVEVAWLQDEATYPLHLRADQKPGEQAVVLTGYVPNEKLREKAVTLARNTLGAITVVDQMVVHPQMVLAMDVPIETNQAYVVQDCLERVLPGITRGLQLSVDGKGVATVMGKVDDFADRRQIIRALQGIPGCTAIKYDLRVSNTPMASTKVPVVVASPVKEVVTKVAPSKVPAPKVDSNFPKPLSNSIEKSAPPVLKQVEGTKKDESKVVPAVVSEPVLVKAQASVVSSSLSGLIPPGMSEAPKPDYSTMIRLGTPTIVRTSFDINLDVMNQPNTNRHVTRPIEIGSSFLEPAAHLAPVPIPVMPREGK